MKKVFLNSVLYVLFACLFTSCLTENKMTSMNKIISANRNNEIKIASLDSLYISWLSASIKNKNQWNWCLQVSEKNGNKKYSKEYYSDLIYFKGEVNEKGDKTGNWEGYYKEKIIVKTSYIGMPNGNSPTYVKIWDANGKLIKDMNFSIVN